MLLLHILPLVTVTIVIAVVGIDYSQVLLAITQSSTTDFYGYQVDAHVFSCVVLLENCSTFQTTVNIKRLACSFIKLQTFLSLPNS